MAVIASHKLLVRVWPQTYVSIDRLAYAPKKKAFWLVYPQEFKTDPLVPRYAEIARVLLTSELLLTLPLAIRVATAVLSNTTLILSGALTDIVHGVQNELKKVVLTATKPPAKELAQAAKELTQARDTGEKGTPNRRGSGEKDPVINITLDEWLYRALAQHLAEHEATVSKNDLKDVDMKSARLYLVCKLLDRAVARPDTTQLMQNYAQAVANIRETITDTVGSEREIIREYLNELSKTK